MFDLIMGKNPLPRLERLSTMPTCATGNLRSGNEIRCANRARILFLHSLSSVVPCQKYFTS